MALTDKNREKFTEESREVYLNTLLGHLAKMLECEKEAFDVVDRTRHEKVSYHIRLPGFIIKR
jgi:hypothetical protein